MKRVVFSCLLIFSSTSFSQTIVTEDSTILFIECDAQFIGGYQELNTYLIENIDYSIIDFGKFGYGKFYVTLVIDTDGKVIHQKLENKSGESILFEDVIPFPTMPNWIPACGPNGTAMKETVRIPIVFEAE